MDTFVRLTDTQPEYPGHEADKANVTEYLTDPHSSIHQLQRITAGSGTELDQGLNAAAKAILNGKVDGEYARGPRQWLETQEAEAKNPTLKALHVAQKTKHPSAAQKWLLQHVQPNGDITRQPNGNHVYLRNRDKL
ncbi:MAG: hypothetical protein ACKO37_05375 [Vampirovibrionales bacterium]